MSNANGLTKNRLKIDGDVLSVTLSQGRVMRTDLAVLWLVETHIWCALKGNRRHTFYASTNIKNPTRNTVYFHTLYTGFRCADHIDRDGLDNCRRNLRDADDKINGRNRRKSAANTSGLTGVRKHIGKRHSYWEAYWPGESKKTEMKYWNVATYGEEVAKELATQARRDACARLGIITDE